MTFLKPVTKRIFLNENLQPFPNSFFYFIIIVITSNNFVKNVLNFVVVLKASHLNKIVLRMAQISLIQVQISQNDQDGPKNLFVSETSQAESQLMRSRNFD